MLRTVRAPSSKFYHYVNVGVTWTVSVRCWYYCAFGADGKVCDDFIITFWIRHRGETRNVIERVLNIISHLLSLNLTTMHFHLSLPGGPKL